MTEQPQDAEQVFARAEALYGKDTVYAFYPHYWSTYCIHHAHTDCRLTCKTCRKPCLCYCHQSGQGAPIDGSQEPSKLDSSRGSGEEVATARPGTPAMGVNVGEPGGGAHRDGEAGS